MPNSSAFIPVDGVLPPGVSELKRNEYKTAFIFLIKSLMTLGIVSESADERHLQMVIGSTDLDGESHSRTIF